MSELVFSLFLRFTKRRRRRGLAFLLLSSLHKRKEKKRRKKEEKKGGGKNNIIHLFKSLLKNKETDVNLTNEIPSQIS